ncbi:hypothetical protein O181_088441 [Austropuccinia psidii MF-1]|uniref:Transposase Tc1-like domain-containing protein n=1 Tax=Austropuccinia psidii MF-1 TaxID=1389203 RepID=A0A9Q3IRJ4_9BASI|nr:hypothetical protein [Austropuccinia psidii MF-1]
MQTQTSYRQGISEPARAATSTDEVVLLTDYKQAANGCFQPSPSATNPLSHPPLTTCVSHRRILFFLINRSTSPIIPKASYVSFFDQSITLLILPYLPQMPYLDVETRGRLVGMRQAGLSLRSIAELNDLPLTTVYKTFQKYQEISTVTTQKKTCRPTKLNDRDWRQLSQIITRCRRLTIAQVASLMTSLVSTQTIQREFHKLGKHSQIAPKKPYLQCGIPYH